MGWASPFDVHSLESHRDPRGYLFEVMRFVEQKIPGTGQMYVFSVEPGKRRGDHFHGTKQEWFTCVHGRITVLLSSLDGQKKAIQMGTDEPKIVYAAPGTSHALLNESNEVAVLVAYSSEEFHANDPDTTRRVAYESYSR